MIFEDNECSDKLLVVDNDQISTLIDNKGYITQEITEIINVFEKAVVNQLHTLDYISWYDIWAPHNLT